MPYLNPVTTIGRLANNDYEAPPTLNNYDEPYLSDSYDDIQSDHPIPIKDSIGSNTMQSSTLPVYDTPPEDEQIYEDPGHIKEKIYEWFKQRNICRHGESSIK